MQYVCIIRPFSVNIAFLRRYINITVRYGEVNEGKFVLRENYHKRYEFIY